jgi:hypothetical protein
VFIPVGCIPLSEAIEQVAFDIDAAAMRPTMPEALSRAEQALQAAGPWSVRPTLRRRAKEGLLRLVRVGSRTLVAGDSLRRLLNAETGG